MGLEGIRSMWRDRGEMRTRSLWKIWGFGGIEERWGQKHVEEWRRDGTRSMWRDRGEMETRYFSLNPVDSFLDTLNA